MKDNHQQKSESYSRHAINDQSFVLVNRQLSASFPFPAQWLLNRIEQVIEEEIPEELRFPELDGMPFFKQFSEDIDLNKEELLLLTLALCASCTPELLNSMAIRAAEKQIQSLIGGVNLKIHATFSPTIRTAVFLLGGQNASLRSRYLTCFHLKQKLFSSGILSAHALLPHSLFADHQIQFNDQFLPAILKGTAPRLDSDPDFPVRCSQSTHGLDALVLKEKANNQLLKLQRFGKHMQTLWQLDPSGKFRANCIAIFSGDPGTGKSFAADAVGNSLGMPVYKVNFAQLVSKYIGETEKNLEKVFDRFDAKPLILFFDEAESIFSKRTEVGDAHDHHANNLQSYLLQKVEEFKGIIILATNVHDLSQYFDRAFQRRFRILVEFEFPDEAERLAIWDKALIAPFSFEAGLTAQLARNYQLSGGSIYNVVSDAVILALDKQQEIITFDLLETPLADEFKKTSRKFEICTDEMAGHNPVKRFGVGYEHRRNF